MSSSVVSAVAVNEEDLLQQKMSELRACKERCRQIQNEINQIKNLCTQGGICNFEPYKARSNHVILRCSKCNKEKYESRGGGIKKRKFITKIKRKSKKRSKKKSKKRSRKKSK